MDINAGIIRTGGKCVKQAEKGKCKGACTGCGQQQRGSVQDECEEGQGLKFDGHTYLIEWWQAMDLKSFWAELGLSYRCKDGYCLYCDADSKNDHLYDRWATSELDRYADVASLLPIPESRSIYCSLHAKLRIVGKVSVCMGECVPYTYLWPTR